MIGTFGSLLMLVGVVWMIYTAVTNESTSGSKALWGILIFLFGPFAGTVYFLIRKAGLVPLIFMWIGVLVYGYSAFSSAASLL